MKREYEVEVIDHPYINYLNVFLVNVDYRTPHLHEDIEIILVLDGQVTASTDTGKFNLGPDSCALFNSHQPHEFHSSKGGTLILCFQISPRLCTYYPKMLHLQFDSNEINRHIAEDYQRYVNGLITELAYQYYCKKPAFEFSCVSLANQLLWIFLQNIPFHFLTDQERMDRFQKTQRLNRILKYIDENYMNKILLSEIAKKENLSLTYLSHFIKNNLNQTFQEYLTNTRFSHARELILDKRIKLIDVCMECGFSDYRYLYQAFVKNYGYSPKEYRDHHIQVSPTQKIGSPNSSERYYSVKNTIDILEKLHEQKL